jgi:hypothetical protein
MRWECSECGCRLERHRPPAVCRSCGTAGALFVEAETGLEDDADAESLYESWIQRGMARERHPRVA